MIRIRSKNTVRTSTYGETYEDLSLEIFTEKYYPLREAMFGNFAPAFACRLVDQRTDRLMDLWIAWRSRRRSEADVGTRRHSLRGVP